MNITNQETSTMLVDVVSSYKPLLGVDQQERGIRLPMELWLEVLKYSTTTSIQAITLTCTTLRWLAQPLLFKTFIIHLPEWTSEQVNPADKHRLDTYARLAVLGCPYIADAITEIRIIPSEPSATESRDRVSTDNRSLVVDTVFAALPYLINLKRLVCHDIVFKRDHLSALCHILQLEYLELQSCSTTCHPNEFPNFSSMSLETLIFNYPYSSLDFFRNYRFLALFLQPRTLKHIFAGPANDILFALTQTPPSDSLSVLEIPVSCVSSPLFLPALAYCPSVQDISLYMAIGNSHLPPLDHLPSNILPNLRSYHGPRTYAHQFIRDRAVTHVEFLLPCQPGDLGETIKELNPNTESLSCKISSLDAPFLKTIHTTLPSLKNLVISGMAVDLDALSSALSIAKVHRGLTSIEVTIQTGEPRLTDTWRTAIAKMFLAFLVRAYPALQTAKLVYQPQTAVVWNRPSSAKRPITVDASDLSIEKWDSLPKTNAIWDIVKFKQ